MTILIAGRNHTLSTLNFQEERVAFSQDMDGFYILFTRYLDEKAKGTKIDWEKIQSPSNEQIVPYADKSTPSSTSDLTELAVLKLNGGLDTTMGCVGPKSAIEVRDNTTFLDLSVHQIEYLNKKHDVSMPFILMNSLNTDDDTKRIVQKYVTHNIDIITFNQSRHRRIKKETFLPVPRTPDSPIEQGRCPSGHGDLYESFYNSGLLDQLLSQGK
ncbi:hypothetical protein HPULCUR_006963 [Helicostylum pulchrum]|uniref:UTP--glucose-1-phosphate uridylyltransferase n=1 Tax=Helicostylum pulchrum TaxID=562976 RepID=A0ABP9Y4M2_9FUNG